MKVLESLKTIILGDPNKKALKMYQHIIDKISALEAEISMLDDGALAAKTDEFKKRLNNGETLDTLKEEAFAVVREAGKRVLNMRHFDMQLLGGLAMHDGRIAEMKTGEGKTLVCTLPAYLNALEGNGVYVITVNDYLAKRDSEWMGQLYEFLGLSVGLLQSGMDQEDRIDAYHRDITYGTNNEFGFDYLRDNLAWDVSRCCQTRRHFAIIDEVDSVLIDEARTPLIISGPIQDSTERYAKVCTIVKALTQDTHFTTDEKHKNIVLSDDGIRLIEEKMNLDSIYSTENMDVAHIATQCLKALHLFKRDIDYVIKDQTVHIVDEFTGRILEGRRYSDGLHQAIEAVENLPIKEESQTLASITYQNYFRMFPKLAGMTGTAKTEQEEFEKIYGLSVLVIPTNRPMVRDDTADVIYKSREEKFKAIAKEIGSIHHTGQPILAGTISIEASEYLSKLLVKERIPHNVLNAKHHEKEAEIIAQAGQKGAVTIATNMAGRGTDIVLGDGVKELGGLFVIGTARHESRRIDNQLRGRSGRQGDPGKSKFFVALDDDLMRMFASDRIAKVMETLGIPDDTPIEHGLVTRSIEKAQTKVEKYHFGIRKQILQFDDVMNRQRVTIYGIRKQILEHNDYTERMKEMIQKYVNGLVAIHTDEKGEIQDISGLGEHIQSVIPIDNIHDVLKTINTTSMSEELQTILLSIYQKKKSAHPTGAFDQLLCRRAMLSTLDKKWMEHLYHMDILREGIGLRAYGQRDPLMEYKREGFDMFQALLLNISEESLSIIYKTDIIINDAPLPDKTVIPAETTWHESGPNQGKTDTVPKHKAKKNMNDNIGRNDPCHCGSGKKYKKCCMP